MKKHHWIAAVLLLTVGYMAGVIWPKVGNSLKGKLTGAA
jgi:hypothetical protein